MRSWLLFAFAAVPSAVSAADRPALKPIPDKLVVLTFDDAVKSHFTVVRPLLKRYRFGATFFVTEGFEFKTNKRHYMTWEEIAHLHRDGFEIGNHTKDHMTLIPQKPDVLQKQLAKLGDQIEHINKRCAAHGIPKTVTFAYPGNGTDPKAFAILRKHGIQFARRGGAPEFPYKEGRGFACEPGLDHPLLVPSAGDARPAWKLADFQRAVDQAKFGRIAVLQFHGVPDLAHPWVHSPVEQFKEYLKYLHEGGFRVIAMRDLAKYVDPTVAPNNPLGVIADRKESLKSGKPRTNFRSPRTEAELKSWLRNMVWYHRFTPAEIRAATGLPPGRIAAALKTFDIRPDNRPKRPRDAPLLVLPYPGGRHPRTGFRDGMIRPQRETKLSAFLPWDEAAYVVLDLPEAIRRNDEAKHGLLYLAHTHVPTMWTKRNVELPRLEWKRTTDGGFEMQRTLPNGVAFATCVKPSGKREIRMEMWLKNGSKETLSNLRVQNCIMLSAAPEFAGRMNDNKLLRPPYVACHSKDRKRWIITAWSPNFRAWANPPCPCMHSDPRFPDCKPGETKRLVGRVWFYEGTDIDGELKRLQASGWEKAK